MRLQLVLSVLALGVGSTQAAWGFNPKAPSVVTATPVETAEPAAPIPAQNPFDDLDAAPLLSAEDPILSARVVPAAPHAQTYLGTEYVLGQFKFRPAELQYEVATLVALALYVLASLVGRRTNAARARAWFDKNRGVFKEEFAAFGVGKEGTYEQDGGDEFVAFATGRRAVESVQVTVKTQPAHDLLVMLYNTVRGVMDFNFRSGADTVTMDFKLRMPVGTPGAKFCCAIVERTSLRAIRDARWDLRTFTNVSEFAGLPEDLIAMAESGDMTSALLKSTESGLPEALRPTAQGREFFESLVISDMPATAPDEEGAASSAPKLPEGEYHLVLTLRLPPKDKAAATKSWVALACNIADILIAKPAVLPGITVVKIRMRRAEVLKGLIAKAPVVEEKKKVELAQKETAVAAKKRQDAEQLEAKLRQMSKSERVAYLEKQKVLERENAIKKAAKAQKKK